MAEPGKLLVGTSKGLLIYPLTEGKPEIHFSGFDVGAIHTENNRLWVALSHKHWGQKLHVSEDNGTTWQTANVPSYSGHTLPNGTPATLTKIWCLATNPHNGDLWVGTDPGGLFISSDAGASFRLNQGLWSHPSRMHEEQWFGAGSNNPFVHSIVFHPDDPSIVYIAVSSAGVFKSSDAGSSWKPVNNGLVAAYLPDPAADVGHDPHRLMLCAQHPHVLWQQNHCGVFFSTDSAASWTDVSNRETIPNYGFTLAVDDENPGFASVIPVTSDEQRVPPGLKLSVLDTHDFGKTWQDRSEGLDAVPVFDIVLRQAYALRGSYRAFGTTSGNLFVSHNDAPWHQLSAHLTKINQVLFS